MPRFHLILLKTETALLIAEGFDAHLNNEETKEITMEYSKHLRLTGRKRIRQNPPGNLPNISNWLG